MAAPAMGGGPRRNFERAASKPSDFRATVKRLLFYLKPDVFKIIISLVCVLVNAGASLTGSYMLRPIINGLVDEGAKKSALLSSLALMALVYLFGVLASYLQSRIMILVSQDTLQRIRNDMFSKMEKLPVRYFDTNATGDIMSRYTNDVDSVNEMLNHTIVNMFSGVITVIGTLCIMFYTNIYLTLVTVVMVPLFIKAGTTIAKRARKFFSEQQAALGRLNGYIEENVTGQNVIKVFCREEKTKEEFSKLNEDLKRKQIRAQFQGGMMGPIMGNLGHLNYGLTALVGCILCVVRNFDIGGLTIFINFSRQFSRPINEFSMQLTNIMSAVAGAERVFKMMDEAPETEDVTKAYDTNTLKGFVEAKDVTFGYVPEKTILKKVSFSAKPGQKIAFVGSTGAGKTTIINLLTRFYDVEDNSIKIDEIDINNIKRSVLRKNIAMVLQDTHLFTGTIMENIRYGRLDATDEEVIQAAKTSCAHSFIKYLPNKYETMIESDGANLSQGQRQLINIARAALSYAPILILDEATSSVDTRTEQQINRGMESLMENRTTFVIAHRLSTIKNSDCIMVLEDGQVAEYGKHEELLDKKGRYFELYTGLKELE